MLYLQKDKVACVPMFDPDQWGSLFIPDSAKERCDQGLVKYIGPDVHSVQPGDHVTFGGYTGTLMELEGEGLLIILPEEFVTAKIEAPDTEIPGLYFLDKEGHYFPSTYEMSMNIIARGLSHSEHFRNFKSFNIVGGPATRPKKEDYDKLR